MAAYQKELGSGFKKALANEEERELEGLEAKLPDLRKEFARVSRERAEVEARKSEIETELSEDMKPTLEERERDLKRVTKLLDTIQKKLNENETAIEEAQQHLQNAETSHLPKRKSLRIWRDVSTQVRNLGVVPETAFSPPYANLAPNVATARLHKVQDALKKYGHMNKKAFEQFAQFKRQRETLRAGARSLG
ncbi:Structural maintenance of chromosomes protein 3 [Elasticomyces elasticus]|nr:Structural maintenance of chromosomes protein 3 [Elasticomyces elasticus]